MRREFDDQYPQNSEDAYYDRFRSGRQAKNIWKYIPQNVMEGVQNAFSDSDGYWVWLEENWVAYDGAPDCGQIHEYTIAGLKEAIKTIRRGYRPTGNKEEA